jgi:hypothetical protein
MSQDRDFQAFRAFCLAAMAANAQHVIHETLGYPLWRQLNIHTLTRGATEADRAAMVGAIDAVAEQKDALCDRVAACADLVALQSLVANLGGLGPHNFEVPA